LSDPIVGIDLGTSNSVVAHANAAGTVAVLSDGGGGKVHPSVVSFHPGGGVVVGAAAKQRKVIDPQNTIYSIKRLIGRSYRSPEVQTARARVPFQIKEGPNSAPLIVTRAGEFAVPEISAIVLDHVRNIATARLDTPVSRAVVTVPASFNDAQRSATATAGAIAGLTVVRVLNEPTAAALAYGHARHLREIVAVYDFGGGTFDVTLLRLEDQVYEVLGTAGDTFLGGDDLDERLVEKMAAKFLAENRIDLRGNEVAMMRLRAVAEQTKIELSRRTRAVVRIDEIAYGPRGGPLHLQIEIARDEFVQEIADLVDRTFPVCAEALALAQLKPDRITDVILVGGTTKVPYVRDQVARFFGRSPRSDLNPEDAVAVGAALQATSLERILSRRSSNRLASTASVPAPASGPTTVSTADVLELTESGVTRLPPEDEDADAAGAPSRTEAPRSDTSYSVTRSGLRDAVADPERAPADGPDDRSSQSQSQPLGRLTRPAAATPPVRGKTMLGGTDGPDASPSPEASELELDGTPLSRRATSRARPITVTGTASPPPPARPGRQAPGARRPAPASQPATGPGASRHLDGGSAVPLLDVWLEAPSATTPPMAPDAPLAPDAPSIDSPPAATATDPSAASTTRGLGVSASLAEPSPAATAKGFQPPQSHAAHAAAPPRPAPVLLEVTPRGLGIATVAGFCEELIRRNSRVPAEMKKLFTTSRDQQDLVRIVVCQGESRRLDQNTVIGDLVLQDLPRRPRGETSIEVTFSLDAAGILYVRARDAQTGAEQHATLHLVGDVAQEDVATSRSRVQQLRR
jgi:molecular chaperone DnaK